MLGGIDVPTAVVSTTVSVIVSVAVSVAMKSTGTGLRKRMKRFAERRRLLREGDHVAINAGTVIGLSGGSSSRVEIRVAPAVSFRTPSRLRIEGIEKWLMRISPQLVGSREHCDPGDLVRYRLGDHFAVARASGQVIVCLPVRDTGLDAGDGQSELDLSSVIAVVVPVVDSLATVYESLFPSKLLTRRLDWRFDINSDLDVQGRGRTQRKGLRFAGRAPGGSTPGQGTPNSGPAGFGGDSLRNLPISTPTVEIVLCFLTDLIERSGYTSIDPALDDLRSEAAASLSTWRGVA